MDQTERDEKTLWDRKYAEGPHRSLAPDPFLPTAYSEFVAETPPGHALDVAGGAGRHSLWLAERGWRVDLLDISEAGINLAKENFRLKCGEAASAGKLEARAVDLSQVHDLGREQYDLIVVFIYLQRSLFPALISALRPGGFLIYKTYTTESRRLGKGPSHPKYLLEPNELLQAFQKLRVLYYHERTKEKGTAELVAQQKLSP